MDELTWTVKRSKRNGGNYHEEAQARIDPWSLTASKVASLKLAAHGWRPVTEKDVEATGTSAGWATLARVVGETEAGRTERFWLFGNIVFLNEERNVALYVELLPAAAEQRRTVDEALATVRTIPLGLRWMGSIVPSGPNITERIRNVEHEIATRYRRLVPPSGWVQVPYFDRSNTMRMSDTKIKRALEAPTPAHRAPRQAKLRLEIQSQRTGNWRIGRARPVTFPAAGMLGVGPHSFKAEERKDGYVYLTVTGGLEPTYRLKRDVYNEATKGKVNVEEKVR